MDEKEYEEMYTLNVYIVGDKINLKVRSLRIARNGMIKLYSTDEIGAFVVTEADNILIKECDKDNQIIGSFMCDLMAKANIEYDNQQTQDNEKRILFYDDSCFDYDFDNTIKQNLDKLKEYTKQANDSYTEHLNNMAFPEFADKKGI